VPAYELSVAATHHIASTAVVITIHNLRFWLVCCSVKISCAHLYFHHNGFRWKLCSACG